MSRIGRVRSSKTILSILIFVYSYFSTAVSTEYGVPIEIKLWDEARRPISHMVDVTNGFGLKVLAEHNFLNDNNIAFSPYGLMGILVALYEGVDGDSSYQIQRAIQLPWHRNVMRIGFRDIHRTLKTYFVPEEGFLAGLALNNENVTFNESYKRVLRFYGFDLENDQLPTFPFQSNTSTTELTTIKATTVNNKVTNSNDKMSTSGTTEIKNKPQEETMTTEPTTTRSSTIDNEVATATVTVAMIPDNKSQDEITTTTSKQVTTTNMQTLANDDISESTTTSITSSTSTIQSTTVVPTTEQGTTTELTATETITQLASNAATTLLTTEGPNISSTSDNIITTTTLLTSNSENDAETISQQTSQATVALTTDFMLNQVNNATTADVTLSTEQTTSTESTTIVSTTANTENTQTVAISTLETQNTDETVSTSGSISTVDSTTSMTTSPASETLVRRKKSLVDFIYTNPPYMDDYLVYRSFDIPLAIPEQNFDHTHFLAHGLKSIQVTYMHYDTILEHAYLPHLEASALRLPLDSDRYYLLVVLPSRGGAAELGRLLARMARESDLSDIYAALRPRRVKGIVPSFTVKGHVTLTTDLQKLGIREVFEPRQRDFSPMTKQSGVYVRSIEQAVSVAIRKYKPDDHKKNRYATNRAPVKFYATYPFLYFVMDASIHVSLMAGKMADPLNSRIL